MANGENQRGSQEWTHAASGAGLRTKTSKAKSTTWKTSKISNTDPTKNIWGERM